MELLSLIFLLVTGLAIWALVALWRQSGRERPIQTAMVGLMGGFAPLLLVALIFQIDPLDPGWGILLIWPTLGAVAAGILFGLIGIGIGVARKWSRSADG